MGFMVQKKDIAYTFMKDMVAEQYRLPWEEQVVHTDGSSCGFPRPTRKYKESQTK
jgi:formamidase